MEREKFTEKLYRILQTIDSRKLPVQVKELYVFGSYARGALEPGDLDLFLVYENPSAEFWLAEHEEHGFSAGRRLHSVIRRALVKPGEKIDLGCFVSANHLVHPDGTARHGVRWLAFSAPIMNVPPGPPLGLTA